MHDLEVARSAAHAGALVVREWFGKVDHADWKSSDVDPVTAADLAAQEAVLGVITHQRPDDAILAEEGETGALFGSRSDGRLWIVDPIDGTVNFLHGVPHVGVSVALASDGVSIVGVVVDVFGGAEYWAVAGEGAFCNDQPISCSDAETLNDVLVATGYPYDRRVRPKVYTDINAAVLAEVRGIRRFGAATLDLAWVASGKLDAYWETALAPWDVAAGMLLVQEAGGLTTNENGSISRIDDKLIVAGASGIQPALTALLARTIPREMLARE